MTGDIDLEKLEEMFDSAAKSQVEKMAEKAKQKVGQKEGPSSEE